MIDKITALPIPAQILFGITTLISVMFTLYFAGKYGLNFKNKSFSLSLGKDKEIINESVHATCTHRIDALSTLQRVRVLEDSIFEQKYQLLLSRQMGYIWSAAKQITSRYVQIYTTLLKSKGKTDPIRTRSCQSYMLILKIIESSIIDYYRLFMKENHLAAMAGRDFESYIEEKAVDVTNLITDLMNDLYYYDRTVTRAELYDANNAKNSDFALIMHTCLTRCREASVASDKIILGMTTELDASFAKFIN